MKHVAVLMGGWSAEREVSLRSGKACADALERLGSYRVSRIDVTRDIAAAEYRFQKWNFEKLIYVVGTPQKLHFQQSKKKPCRIKIHRQKQNK